jgi:DNA transformation protein and related proteins
MDEHEDLADLPGLGPRSAAALRRIGISTAGELRARDAFEIYARLRAEVPGTSLNFLYALIGAQDGLSWQEVRRRYRTEILLRLEAMKLAPK